MAEISYEDLASRLTPDASTLFREMAMAHLGAGAGDKLFIRCDTLGGTGMIFSGANEQSDWRGFDGGAIEDLIAYGLLHLNFGGRGSPNYRISGEGLAYYRWLMQREGSAVNQMEEQVRQALFGDAFAETSPDAAHHLREAFDLLWQGRADEQVVSEIGDHLRKALMDAVSTLLGPDAAGSQEKPIQRLTAHLATLSPRLGSREAEVLTQLVELARVVLGLDHRLNHARDEIDKRLPAPTWDETRRAAFTTALVCYELDRLPNGT